jgi:hypothetical protein
LAWLFSIPAITGDSGDLGDPPIPLCFSYRKNPASPRSPHMTFAKQLRLTFYLLATLELVLMSMVWGRLPLH